MAKAYTTEEIFGISPDQLPQFSLLLKETEIYGKDIPEKIKLRERKNIAKAFTPFIHLIEKSGCTPLLMELAIIDDLKFQPFNGQEGEHIGGYRKPEFLSLICSMLDNQKTALLLNSWVGAMNVVLDQESEDSSSLTSIVPHPGTYGDGSLRFPYLAYLTESLSDNLEPLQNEFQKDSLENPGDKKTDEDRATQLAKGGNIFANSLKDGLKWLALLGNGSDAPNETTSEQRPAFTANRFPFIPPEKGMTSPVTDTITQLTTNFIRMVSKNGELNDELTPYINSVRSNLKNCELLIVPFRRPKKQNDASLKGVDLSLSDKHGPGGCIFIILKPEEGKTIKDHNIPDLAVRIGWLLGRSSLLEAHTELDFRKHRQQTVASLSHTLRTEAGVAAQMIYTVRRGLSTGKLSTYSIVEDLQMAEDTIKRIYGLTNFAVKAEEASIKGQTINLQKKESLTSMHTRLGLEVEGMWRRIKYRYKEVDKKWMDIQAPKVNLVAKDEDCERQFYSDEKQNWITVMELLKNALDYGCPQSSQAPSVTLKVLSGKPGKMEAVMVMENFIPDEHYKNAIAAIDGNIAKVGLTSIGYAANACGFMIYEPSIPKGSRCFVHAVVVGISR